MYYQEKFVGVVGMDFDYTVLTEIVHKIKIYENGFAHLEINGEMINDGTETTSDIGLTNHFEEYLRVSKDLTNGMTLVLSASYNDIREIRYDIAYKILFIGLIFVLAFSLSVIFMVKKIVKPLKELTNASIKLSNGNYDVEIAHSNILEINLLSTAFSNMIIHLREHKNLQHRLAHRDSLTGLRNTTSFKAWGTDFDKKIQEGDISFGIAVLDINKLKETNDLYGHILGNELITTASRIICDTFKKSPVFRIGGDEFCVILQNRDLANVETLLEHFDTECKATYVDKDNVRFPVSIAKGFAEFDSEKDTRFLDVFERADSEMYKNKKYTRNTSK
jgi:diguanylate cyclase (GGDEF)-like protein